LLLAWVSLLAHRALGRRHVAAGDVGWQAAEPRG